MQKSFIHSILLALWTTLQLQANNLQLSNISSTTTTISFEIAWDNSWNLASIGNHDAVWVFIKHQDCDTQDKLWVHTLLSTSSAHHSVGGGILQIDAVADGMGVFIRRSSEGSGNISASQVTLAFATPFLSTANMNFEIIGIEMVYIPEGAFYVGDGSTGSPPNSQNSFGNNNTSSPYEIISEDALGTNVLAHPNMGAPTQHAPISEFFPKGYAAFYCMKYEISQSQYVKFLNLITYSQQANRTSATITDPEGTLAMTTPANQNRNSIRIRIPAELATLKPAVFDNDLNNDQVYGDGAALACNYLSWDDLLAYLDWAALRPMTELEFEKASRGPSSHGSPVLAGYAWGTTNITQTDASSLSNAGNTNEISTITGNGLCAHLASSSDMGPLRVGFAATASSNREEAGASYYGVMELSGNVYEQCLHVGYNGGSGNGAAPIFEGNLGDGALSSSGYANAANWGTVIRSVVRGGNWKNIPEYCRTSNRQFITSAGGENEQRKETTGGRGVR
ncbi:MAG: formylglycine-generating enzyme family protein [Flavobacteriales bacterium]